ncbi:PAP2 superfamily protein [Motilibacter peucedani]|uniref:PAP2 superfamily protein n=1 Tax=Motilibacter peucedani TaxID=598650 RepID=A0A420XK27_9ACTN|nr:phosphatase PAP2 family protein [Motilibacter peucedani]RKS67983.1 PAP2 superfamily protein [Motilibacter peucedani]
MRTEQRRPAVRLLHELVVLGGLWLVYSVGRGLAGRHTTGAPGHASDVWSLERRLHLPSEAALQRFALHSEDLVRVANVYYEFEHFVTLGLVSLYLLLVRPEKYDAFRRVLVATTALALVGHVVYPLMPPRMRPDFGIVDTGVRFGQSVYGADPHNHGLLNQYAAMPSMHVAWAFLFAGTVIWAARSRWRWLMLLDPVATTWVVVVTGNHYWVDGIVGVLCLLVAWAACSRWRR